MMHRALPNIIITGTPCVGKTTTCAQLVALASELLPTAPASSSSDAGNGAGAGSGSGPVPLRLRHLAVNQLVREKGCHEGWDDGVKSWIVDEERLGDEVEKIVIGFGGEAEGDGEGEVEVDGGGGGGGGWLIDWHACDLFPQRWVDLVVVLRCGSTEVMWDRLKERYVGAGKPSQSLHRIFMLSYGVISVLPFHSPFWGWGSPFFLFLLAEPEIRWPRGLRNIMQCNALNSGIFRDYPEAKLQENLDAEIFGVLLEEAREAFDEEMVVELKSETVEDVDENCERILQWIQTWREDQRKKLVEEGGDDG
jgi:broad-specificity NMP kinase